MAMLMQAIVPVVMPGAVFVAMGLLAAASMVMRMATESGDGAVDHSGGTVPLVVPKWLRGQVAAVAFMPVPGLGQGLSIDASLPGSTTASRTHLLSPVYYSTSSSLTRISVPPVA
jgi:hypothetical protein